MNNKIYSFARSAARFLVNPLYYSSAEKSPKSFIKSINKFFFCIMHKRGDDNLCIVDKGRMTRFSLLNARCCVAANCAENTNKKLPWQAAVLLCYLTLILHLSFFLPYLTVILALPFRLALTLPVYDTEATRLLEDLKETTVDVP